MTRPLHLSKIRTLLVPDSIHWVTGTIAQSIARFNPCVEATIVSGPVLYALASEDHHFFKSFDLVHFLCPYASAYWLAHLRAHLPCVTTHHHVTLWETVEHNLRGDAVMVGSRAWEEDLRRRGAPMEKVICVPYGVDASRFVPVERERQREVRARIGCAEDATLIGFFAKKTSSDSVDRKGTDVFAGALRELSKCLPRAAALIVGPGWAELVDRFKQEGIPCTWFPFIPNEEGVATMYQALDFYWVTSRIEGGPMPLLEAMSTGVTCLSTPVGLAKEIVRDGVNAFFIPFDNVTALVTRTLTLAGDRSERLRVGQEARATILAEMDAKFTLKRVRALYRLAMRNFNERTRRQVSTSIALGEFGGNNGEVVENERKGVPLFGLTKRVQRKVRMMEDIFWAEHLITLAGQKEAGLKLLAKAWLDSPISLQPARVFLRSGLPSRVVNRIVTSRRLWASIWSKMTSD